MSVKYLLIFIYSYATRRHCLWGSPDSKTPLGSRRLLPAVYRCSTLSRVLTPKFEIYVIYNEIRSLKLMYHLTGDKILGSTGGFLLPGISKFVFLQSEFPRRAFSFFCKRPFPVLWNEVTVNRKEHHSRF